MIVITVLSLAGCGNAHHGPAIKRATLPLKLPVSGGGAVVVTGRLVGSGHGSEVCGTAYVTGPALARATGGFCVAPEPFEQGLALSENPGGHPLRVITVVSDRAKSLAFRGRGDRPIQGVITRVNDAHDPRRVGVVIVPLTQLPGRVTAFDGSHRPIVISDVLHNHCSNGRSTAIRVCTQTFGFRLTK